MLEQLPLVFAALLVGMLVGLTGVGGGAVMTPVLILLFGIPPVVAIATDLVFATVSKLAAALVHAGKGSVDWAVAKKIWRGSIPGVVIGVLVLVYLSQTVLVAVNFLLVGLLIFTAVSMLVSIGVSKHSGNRLSVFGGAFMGFSVATTSVGAGAMGMALLRSMIGDKDPKRLIGTDIVLAIPTALIAGISYFFAGFLDVNLLLVMLFGSLPGVVIGSLLTGKINPIVLRKVLAVVLLIAAVGVLSNTLGVI